jgi:hypothetical protein
MATIEFTNLQRRLDSFGKYIVKQARTNLTKKKKNANKNLYNSIKFKVFKSAKGIDVTFYMLGYGSFVDKGVSGNEVSRTYKNWLGKESASPFQYKSKQPPSGIIEKWIKIRGIKARDEQGKFTSTTRKSLAFLIARSIKLKGIKSTSFFQRPMQLAMKRFGKDILLAIKEDIMGELKASIEKNK